METLPIWRRLFGSVMDKLIILVLFIIIGCILSPYGFSGDLGTFVGGILKDSPSSFQYTELAALKRHDETLNLSLLDFKICFLFILVNVVYYLFGESVVRGSFGKRIFEGIVATKDGNAIPRYKYILRALTLGVLMALFSYLRYIIDISYTMTIVLFFMILDIPVLISRKSLIDIITNTIYIRRTKAQEQTERQTNNADKGKRKTHRLLSKKKVLFLKAGLCFFSLTFIILLFFVSPLSIHNLKYFHKIDGTDIYTLPKGKITTRTTPVLNDRRGPIPHGVFLYAIEGNTEVVTDYEYWTNYPPNTESVPYSISVYDVSSYIETFPDKESYKHLLENFDKRLQGYYDFDLMLRKNPAWHKWYGSFYKFRYTGATSYFFYDAKTKEHGTRTVFFAKKKAYILEVKGAEYTCDLATDNIINQTTTLPLNDYTIRILLGILLSFTLTILCFGSILGFYRKKYKADIINKTANKLIKYSTYMTIISGVLLLLISVLHTLNVGDNPYYPDVPSTLCIVSLISVLLNVTFVIPYIYTRSCNSDKYDYLIPEKISKWMDKKLTDEREKRSLVALFFYPLYTGLPLPLGIGIFGYIIPFGVILYLSIQIRSLSGWIKAENKQGIDKKNVFCDYYVLLNLTFEATQEDIDKAFNAHLAKYNADSNNPLYGKDYLSELREAYAVLSSSNQLRPQYDNEYQLYKQSNLVNYEFENKQLEMSIKKIRTKLYGTSKTKKTLNVITLSFLILWMLVFIVLCIFDVIPLSDWLNFENNDNYYGPSDF